MNMERKKKTAQKKSEETGFAVCSAGDCTGLIPALPESDEELEAYEELYPNLPKAREKE